MESAYINMILITRLLVDKISLKMHSLLIKTTEKYITSISLPFWKITNFDTKWVLVPWMLSYPLCMSVMSVCMYVCMYLKYLFSQELIFTGTHFRRNLFWQSKFFDDIMRICFRRTFANFSTLCTFDPLNIPLNSFFFTKSSCISSNDTQEYLTVL